MFMQNKIFLWISTNKRHFILKVYDFFTLKTTFVNLENKYLFWQLHYIFFANISRVEKNLLERSVGYILHVSVNVNSFCVQCSVIASAALTRDRVLYYLPGQVKFYFLSFYVINIKRLFQRNKLLYYLEQYPFTEYVGQSTT